MKYVVCCEEILGDVFTEELDDLEKAVSKAEYQWAHLTKKEKARCTMYVLESVNPDEEASDHLDGNYVWYRTLEIEELSAEIRDAAIWTEEILDQLRKLAGIAGIDPAEYEDHEPFYLQEAVEKALRIDLGC